MIDPFVYSFMDCVYSRVKYKGEIYKLNHMQNLLLCHLLIHRGREYTLLEIAVILSKINKVTIMPSKIRACISSIVKMLGEPAILPDKERSMDQRFYIPIPPHS